MGLLDAPFTATAGIRESLTSTAGGPLYAFYAALAARNVDILVLGDSKSEGQGASVLSKRWTDVLRDSYRAQFGLTGGIGYVPAWSSAAGTPSDISWAYGGTITNNGQEVGLGRHHVTLGSAATATLTFTGTSIKVFFGRKNTSADAVSIRIDGGSASTFAIPGTAGGATTSGAVWTSPALTAGSHTIVITQTGGSVLFEGAMIYAGDEVTGIRTWNGGHSGYYASYYTDGDTHSGKWQGMLNQVNPDLTIIAFGTNEWRTNPGRTPDQFRQDIKNLIAAVRTKATTSGAFLLVMYEEPLDPTSITPAYTFAQYVNAAYDVASQDTGGVGGRTGVAMLDLTKRMPKGTNPDPYGLHTDGIHLTDAGNLFVRDVVQGFITPK